MNALYDKRITLPPDSPFSAQDLKDTVRTSFLGWFATLTDRDGRAIYAFDCLFTLFPERKAQIIKAQLSLEAVHEKLQQFRNNVAFHARAEVADQITARMKGYVFDGADQSQMAFWTCTQTATSSEHVHEFDEYMLVVQGCYTLLISGKRIPVNAGEEYLIPRGVAHSGEVVAGTRTIHAFGGHRAGRERNV